MAKVNVLAPFIFSWEGGFVNHPNDRGGATNMGVTIATYEAYCKKKGLTASVEALKNLTKEEVIEILKSMFWDRCRADEIKDQSIANIIVDWVWASGAWGIKHAQRAMGLTQDGIIGPITLKMINDVDPLILFNTLKMTRENHFESIAAKDPTQQVFLKGWLNRLRGIQYGKLVCNGGQVVEF